MERQVRTSAKAVILRGSEVLLMEVSDGKENWFILPGGGQNAGELLPQTVAREVAEELGVSVTVGDLAFVIEGAQGESFHRVDLVFWCRYEGDLPDAPHHGDTGQVGARWVPVGTLLDAPLYPSRLRRAILDRAQRKPGAVYLGNEQIGDPVCLDRIVCPEV